MSLLNLPAETNDMILTKNTDGEGIEQAHTGGAKETSLIRESLLLSIIMGMANLANIFFQIIMGRWLTATDYGVLMAMIGILYILNVPADSFRTVMAYFAAKYASGGGDTRRQVTALYHHVMVRLSVVAVLIIVAVMVCSPWLIRIFHLEGPGPLYAAALVCVSTLAMTTFQGVLQGMERFGWYGVSMNCWFWGRLICSALLVYAGFRATGALCGMTVGALAGVIVPRVLLRRELFHGEVPRETASLRPLYRYIAKVTLAYALFMMLANMDVLAVKHWFSPEVAGDFSRGAMLAHLIWLMPFPVVMAMFPKLVISRNDRNARRRLLIKGVGVAAGASFLLAAVLFCFRRFIFQILFRAPENIMIHNMLFFLGAMLPVSFLFVLLNYDLALNKRTFLGPLAAGNAALAATFLMRHDSIAELLHALFAVCWLLFFVHLLLFCFRNWTAWKRSPAA